MILKYLLSLDSILRKLHGIFVAEGNYRPIAIKSIPYKGFKAVMTKNITKHIDT